MRAIPFTHRFPRSFLALRAAAVVALALVVSAGAYAWPTQPVRIIVPSSAGASPDNMIRLIAARLGPLLHEQVVVENKVGAGGIPARQAFEASRDEHTFLLTLTSTTTVAPYLFKAAARFDFLRDTQPVMTIGETPFMVVANPRNGAKTLNDLLAMARVRPGQIPFATPPLSSVAQLSSSVLSRAADVTFNFIPFSRSSESLGSVYSGDTDFLVDTVSAVLPFVRDKRVRPLAVLSASRLPGLEQYPLASETLPGVVVSAGFGLVAPAGTPGKVVDAMYKAVARTLEDPALIQQLQDMAIYIKPGGPAAYRETLQKEAAFWRPVILAEKLVPQ